LLTSVTVTENNITDKKAVLSEICEDCYRKIPFVDKNVCKILSDDPDRQCEHLDEIYCACDYSGIVRDALIRYKFSNKPCYVRALAYLLHKGLDGSCHREENGGFDMIISVPLHKERKLRRGYNQSMLLSRELSKRTGIKDMSGLLERNRDTKAQSLLNRDERLKNVRGAFSVINPHMVNRKNILLVDDILTTGSTLNECARVLKESGAAFVAAAVVAASSVTAPLTRHH